MSANVDQRSKGQPSQVSNANGKDVMKEDDPYMQQAPQHSVRSWSDQASDGAYGAAPMPTAGVSDSFFHNYYAPNMSYPFMSQGLGGSEASWSNSADSMFSMGYDYSNVYGGFGFPFNNWEYPSDYWSGSQPVRKDQRGYAEDPYYSPEMIPPDSYGMMNGTAPPPEPQEPIGTVEQGLRNMSIVPPASAAMDSRKKMVDISQPPILNDGFGGGDPALMMSPMPSNSVPGGISGGNSGGSQGSSKKTSWAAIASQPARPQQQMRPRTIPRAPVHPNKSMDIGTWDTRGNPAKSPMSMTQTLPSQPPPPRQSWATNSTRSRQIQPHSTSGPGNVTGPGSGSSNSSSNLNSNTNSTANNSSGSNATSSNNSNANNSNNVVTPASNSNNSMSGSGGHPSSYAGYPSSAGNTVGNGRNAVNSSSASANGSYGDGPMPAMASLTPPNPIVDQLKSSNLYNPKEFNLNPKSARFFVIKSYSEDDIHRSIKYNIWCSTEHGNKRLDQAFREREGKGPVYLIYSVNGSGHFCGIAQMMSPVDYQKSAGVWAQDKWKGQLEVKWVYVKDVPNSQLRHIRLENNENKPVTNSRDTQEVPPEKGKQVLRIMHSYKHQTSIFDDFIHYEKRQEEDQHQTHQSHQHSMQRDNRGDHHSGHNNHRDMRQGGEQDRDGHHRNDHYRNDGRGDHRGDGRGDHRYDNRGGDFRGDHRENRGGFDRDHRDRGDGRTHNHRDNRRGGRQN